MDILRFITAGSIDDGKSTLIGRLLLDTKNIKTDILDSIKAGNEINLAFITDGLRAERQAGITIDVAYKYFTTPHRKYIITDAPGHFQYTKNLVTGASGVDVMIILIDATIGISMQTRRHAMVASFLGIRNIVVAINKMDLVGYNQSVYTTIKNEFLGIAAQLKLHNVHFIPMSALHGDNVTFRSEKMGWYKDGTMLQFLEECMPEHTGSTGLMRLAVQYVRNGQIYGRVVSGSIKMGENVGIYPAGSKAVVKQIIHGYAEVGEAIAGEDVCVLLDGNIAVKRGDMIAHSADKPECNKELEADLCWLDTSAALELNKDYILRTATAETTCRVKEIISKTDIDTWLNYTDEKPVSVNEFARISVVTGSDVVYDNFSILPGTGRAILIDKDTNNTSGALIIR